MLGPDLEKLSTHTILTKYVHIILHGERDFVDMNNLRMKRLFWSICTA